MTIYVMHREVCLKHRKNRREIFLRVRTQVPSWQRCLFFFCRMRRGCHNPRRSFGSPVHQPPLFPSAPSAVIVQEQDS